MRDRIWASIVDCRSGEGEGDAVLSTSSFTTSSENYSVHQESNGPAVSVQCSEKVGSMACLYGGLSVEDLVICVCRGLTGPHGSV